ncbi:MAG: preprotein translocase subunit SecE [Polyangiaceae bacterium]|nr:preprotein translocase subunit SecE [Polyangiaceae bacterium]
MAKDVDEKDESEIEDAEDRSSSDEVESDRESDEGEGASESDESEDASESESDEPDEKWQAASAGGPANRSADAAGPEAEGGDDSVAPAHLGDATKYVHAAFFGAGILVAYLSSKLLATAWSELAEWPAAVQVVPQLLRYAEDDRGSIMMLVGAAIGIVSVVQTYRKERIRQWADEVASELAKVTWPVRETVTNGTIVVIIASLIATTYIGLLDRLWGFLTNLVYGA